MKFLLLAFSYFLLNSAIAQKNSAVIINDSEKKLIFLDYIGDYYLNSEHAYIKPNSSYTLPIVRASKTPVTVFMPTNKYAGLSIAVLPGDTVRVFYDVLGDTYKFTSRHTPDLTLYKQFGESKFSLRSLPSPLSYNGQPLTDYIKSWRDLCNESKNFITKTVATPGIRPEIKAHLVFEARLRLLQLLVQPAYKEIAKLSKPPLFYRDTVLAYEKKIGVLGDNRAVPSIAFAHRGHASVVAASEGKVATFPIQYEVAKREYTGYQREWTCYSILKDMFTFNDNPELLPALLKDYQSWVAADSPFLKRMLELTQNNDLAILSKADLNDELVTLAAKPARLFDIVQQHKGQVLYVDMWASWCKPCIEELPASLALQEAYRAQPVAIVYLSIDADQEKWLSAVANFLAPTTINYRLHDEKQSGLVKRLQIKAIPRYLLIDKQGVLRYSNAPPPSAPGLRKLIDSLL